MPSDSERKVIDLAKLENWPANYWSYNLPLQMWPAEHGTWRVINYAPRKELCIGLDETVTKEELPQFCGNAAAILRNLADLFDALSQGKIDTIYYPDKLPLEAIKEYQQEPKP